jgi:hypothetical protein
VTKNITDTIKKADAVLKDYELPEKFQPFLRTILRFEDKITLSQAIISAMLILAFFLITAETMKFFFYETKTGPLIGIVLALLFSMLGVVKTITLFLQHLGEQVKLLQGWFGGVLIIIAIIIAAVSIISIKLIDNIRKRKELHEAREKGAKAAENKAYVESQRAMRKNLLHRI